MSEQCTGHRSAIVFDLDDTLFPLKEYIDGACRRVADYVHTVYGLAIHNELLEARFAETNTGAETEDALCGLERAIVTALGRHFKTIDVSLVNRLAHVYRSHVPSIDLYADAARALALLRALSIPVGLVPGGPSQSQRIKVAALGLAHLVDTIVYPAEMLGGNRTEAALRLIELQTGSPLAETVFVGAPHSSFDSAKQAGMMTVLIRRATSTHRIPPGNPSPKCDITVPSLKRITQLFTAPGGLAAAA